MALKLLIGLAVLPLVVALVPAMVRRPLRTAFAAYVLTVPIGSVVQLGIPLPPPFNTVSSALGGLAIVACLANVALYRRGSVPTVPVGMWLLFLAWGTATALWAINPPESLGKLTVALPLLLLMVAVALVRPDPSDLDALRLAVIASGIIVGVYAFGLYATGSALPSYGVDQRFHFEGGTDPNILAASLLLPLSFSLERLLVGGTRWMRPGMWRIFGMAGAFFTFVAILLTGSRGGTLAAVAAFVFTLVWCRGLPEARPWVRRTILGVVIAVVAVPVGVVIAAAVSPQPGLPGILSAPPIQRIFNPEGDTSGRREIWTAGVIACRTYCATGAGFANFPYAFNEEFAFSGAAKSIELNQAPHNVLLGLVVETGAVGLTLFGLGALLEWRSLSTPAMRARIPALRAGLAGIFLANVFLSAIWFKYFWLPFTLARVAERIPGERARPD